jgi:hypothetical protein
MKPVSEKEYQTQDDLRAVKQSADVAKSPGRRAAVQTLISKEQKALAALNPYRDGFGKRRRRK